MDGHLARAVYRLICVHDCGLSAQRETRARGSRPAGQIQAGVFGRFGGSGLRVDIGRAAFQCQTVVGRVKSAPTRNLNDEVNHDEVEGSSVFLRDVRRLGLPFCTTVG